jgi:hypothetical protein
MIDEREMRLAKFADSRQLRSLFMTKRSVYLLPYHF